MRLARYSVMQALHPFGHGERDYCDECACLVAARPGLDVRPAPDPTPVNDRCDYCERVTCDA